MFFVNPPICVLVVVGVLALLPRPGAARRRGGFDPQGAVLVTGGMLLLVYSLVRAPVVGWGSIQTILTLAGAAVLVVAFASTKLAAATRWFPSRSSASRAWWRPT